MVSFRLRLQCYSLVVPLEQKEKNLYLSHHVYNILRKPHFFFFAPHMFGNLERHEEARPSRMQAHKREKKFQCGQNISPVACS